MTQWRHKVRGLVYEVLTHSASLQCSSAPEIEQRFDGAGGLTVYRNVKTGMIWVRPTPEFLDGRFERVGEPTHD